MRSSFRRMVRWGSTLTAVTVFATLFVTAGPAQAYRPDPSVYWIVQDAGDCTRISGTEPADMFEWADYGSCYLEGSRHSYYHGYDADSRNVFLELWVDRGPMIGEIQFQANGEWLRVTDTENDGDTFYVWINGTRYHVEGTSSETDMERFNLDLADGVMYSIRITDDAAGHDVIATSTETLPYLVP